MKKRIYLKNSKKSQRTNMILCSYHSIALNLLILLIPTIMAAQSEGNSEANVLPNLVTKEIDYRPQGRILQVKSGQNTDDGYDQLLENITPVSPQAAAIEKNSCYSIDYSTGVPQISIPLYEIKVGNYTLPITINYHASGIKVQDMATPVGLGWVLNAGGVINRLVRGTEDDIENNTLNLEYTSESEIDYAMAYSGKLNYFWYRLAAKGDGDTESDRYTYSINGKSGVFRYCVTDNSIRTIPYSGIKIANISTGGYVITDTDGTKYYFQEGETNSDYSATSLTAVTTWYITKIEPSSSKNVIEFTYALGKTYTMEYITQIDNRGHSYEMVYKPYPYDWYDLEENINFGETINTYHGSYHGIKLLTQISWAGNTMTFNYQQDRKELNLNLDRLQSVVVKYNNSTVVRTINLDNDHYLGSNKNNYRMMLNELTIQGSSSAGAVAYRFGYNTTELPNYFIFGTDINCHEDYWGYYNGNNIQNWIPTSEYSASNGSTNNRTPNDNYMKAGTLVSIHYPTGGSTEFEMESNVTSDGRSWGGLRVKSQTDKDADGTEISRKTYQYENADVSEETSFSIYSYDVDYCYAYRDIRGLQWDIKNHTIKRSSPFMSLTADLGSPIYYGMVTETVSGLGKTEYYYTINRGSLNNMEDNGHIYDPLRLYSVSYNFDRGNVSPTLYKRKIYALENNSYKLKRTESYIYAEIPRDTFRLGVRFEQSNVLINYGGIDNYGGVFENSPVHYTFCYSDVWAVPSFFILSAKSITDYDGKVTTTTSYDYDSQYRTLEPTSETVTVSNGEALTTQYTYPFQKTGSVYSAMTAANMQIPIESRTFRANVQTNSSMTTYSSSNGLYLPSAYYVGKGSNSPEMRIQYDYDSKGNLAYVVKDNTQKTVFLWGYQGMYPVARIEGLTKSEVYSALGNTVTTLLGTPTDANIWSVNTNNTISSNGLATTYAWKPLVGISAIRKPDLETTYYTYDAMGRLASVKDRNNSTIEEYAYNYGGSTASNYVRTRTMTNPSGNAYRDTYSYYDGLGRKIETVAKEQSPNGSDLVTLYEYDALDRTVKEWLPTTSSSAGSFVNTSSYKSALRPYYNNDTKPFMLTEYEPCPSGKQTKKYGPGSAWQDSGRGLETSYSGNNANDVIIYTASNDDSSLTGNGRYAANRLFVETTKNEDRDFSYTFTDKEGRLILERRMAGSEKYDTYYVYDIYGNLAFVLPPAASEELVSGTWSISNNSILQNYAYNYRYDSRNRCIEKKLPGCEKVTMTYDTADRLVTYQDGVQRLSGQSTYYEYDKYSRQTAMGTKTSSGVKTPLLINYYDSYSYFSNLGSTVSNYSYNTSGGSDGNYANVRGLLAGTRVSQLSSPTTYTYTALHYGERERLVQSHSSNHLGGYNHEYYNYNFTGTVATKKLVHSASGKTTQTELYSNTYDVSDRLKSVTHKLNSYSTVTLEANTYDAVGRLFTRKQMSNETVTYANNVRSWLTGISSTHFTETMAYNVAIGSLTPSTTRWGGDISAMSWKAGNESATRSYQFGYNALDWLTSATYSGVGSYSATYAYDKMGNVNSIVRYGRQDGGTYGKIDQLSFTYTGNQVTRIDDSTTDPTYSGVFNFMDGASQANEYTYDKNGNLTKDLNKKISSIQYNLLNLPQNIVYSTGKSATYTYDAAGRKLRVVYTNPGSTTDYCGNMVYEGGTLKQIQVDGGYITFNSSTPVYHYYLRDHLGNNRVVCNASGSVEQVNHYYPFGGLFGESTGGDTQRYKYNGKELDRMHGLDWYDYGTRNMTPDIGRFTTIDSMAEKNPDITPYHYCHNNPFIRIDPDGKDDYYNSDGIYLGTNRAKTDFIYISNEGQYRKLENGKYAINISSRVSLNNAELTAHAYSNIFTNCFRLGGGNCNELADRKIQVTVWQRSGGSKFSENHTSESAFEGNGLASTSKDQTNGAKITVYIWPQGEEERNLFSTRSNINSTIIDHEFKGHYKDGLVHIEGVPDPTFKKQKESINWKRATQEYKDYFNIVIEEHGWK